MTGQGDTSPAVGFYASRAETAPHPPLDNRGFHRAPVFYPRLLRQVADTLDALAAFELEDPTRRESPHFVGAHGFALPIYDVEAADDDDELAALTGWLVQYDGACWVFVPHIPEFGEAGSA